MHMKHSNRTCNLLLVSLMSIPLYKFKASLCFLLLIIVPSMWCWCYCFLCSRHASRTHVVRSCDCDEVSDWTGLFGHLSSLIFYFFSLSFSLSWCGLVLLSCSSHSEYMRETIQRYTMTGSEGADFPWCTTLTLPSVFMLCENLVFFSGSSGSGTSSKRIRIKA